MQKQDASSPLTAEIAEKWARVRHVNQDASDSYQFSLVNSVSSAVKSDTVDESFQVLL
jgi:hypothetical protein